MYGSRVVSCTYACIYAYMRLLCAHVQMLVQAAHYLPLCFPRVDQYMLKSIRTGLFPHVLMDHPNFIEVYLPVLQDSGKNVSRPMNMWFEAACVIAGSLKAMCQTCLTNDPYITNGMFKHLLTIDP